MKVAIAILAIAVLSSACDFSPSQSPSASRARSEVERKAEQRHIYTVQNDIEFKNYNRRQEIADDPTTILWCTSAFPVPSSPLFTVPVVGKLTSGGKRPYPTEKRSNYSEQYYPEQAGPDGMYGASGEYRYGFTPGGVYVDFYNISTFCTTEPTIWQRESTEIVMAVDPRLAAAHERARELLRAGKPDEAYKVLEEAIRGVRR